MSDAPGRALLAEAIGTFFLLAAIAGSGIMGEMLAAGQEGVALLPHALTVGAVLAVFIALLGPVSGAHFNPAVTAAFWLRGEIALPRALAYVAVQVAAGIGGVLASHLMFDLDVVQVAIKPRASVGLWVSEAIATFGLAFVILAGLRVDRRLIPWLVGLYITASTSFANPAVTVARALTDTFAGIRPADVPPFVLAQLAGATLALPVVAVLWPEAEQPPAA